MTLKDQIVNIKRRKYPEKFAEIGGKPHIIDLLPYLLYSFYKGAGYRKKLLRSFRINRIPLYSVTSKQLVSLPVIELIINSERKDFRNLCEVITYAITNSVNPIEKTTVAVPASQVSECREVLSGIVKTHRIEVLSEDLFLTDSIREKLRNTFGKRYGWALQQFLTIDRVLKSDYKGVLQVNSDTILLRPTQWIDSEGRQPILVSTEYHLPYYVFLHSLNMEFPVLTDSHITHHMLFQPEIFKEILRKSSVETLEKLVDFTIANAQVNADSPICVEFELYALGALRYFPERITLAKFGNINYPRRANSSSIDFQVELGELAKKYSSISAHSYL
jgi:hypothetical protein